jgi:hypothetical protein
MLLKHRNALILLLINPNRFVFTNSRFRKLLISTVTAIFTPPKGNLEPNLFTKLLRFWLQSNFFSPRVLSLLERQNLNQIENY